MSEPRTCKCGKPATKKTVLPNAQYAYKCDEHAVDRYGSGSDDWDIEYWPIDEPRREFLDRTDRYRNPRTGRLNQEYYTEGNGVLGQSTVWHR